MNTAQFNKFCSPVNYSLAFSSAYTWCRNRGIALVWSWEVEERLLLLEELITDPVLSSYNFLEGLIRKFDVILYTCLFYYGCIVSVVTFQFLQTLGKLHQLIGGETQLFLVWQSNSISSAVQ